MGIYLFIFLGLSIIGLIYPKVREKKLCIFLFFLVVFLISAFREFKRLNKEAKGVGAA